MAEYLIAPLQGCSSLDKLQLFMKLFAFLLKRILALLLIAVLLLLGGCEGITATQRPSAFYKSLLPSGALTQAEGALYWQYRPDKDALPLKYCDRLSFPDTLRAELELPGESSGELRLTVTNIGAVVLDVQDSFLVLRHFEDGWYRIPLPRSVPYTSDRLFPGERRESSAWLFCGDLNPRPGGEAAPPLASLPSGDYALLLPTGKRPSTDADGVVTGYGVGLVTFSLSREEGPKRLALEGADGWQRACDSVRYSLSDISETLYSDPFIQDKTQAE